jgi:hypothetical protein
MKWFIVFFFVATALYSQEIDSIAVCDTAMSQAHNEHNNLLWMGGSVLAPFVFYGIDALVKPEPDSIPKFINANNIKTFNDCFYKKEKAIRQEDILIGSVIGIVCLIWYGLILF